MQTSAVAGRVSVTSKKIPQPAPGGGNFKVPKVPEELGFDNRCAISRRTISFGQNPRRLPPRKLSRSLPTLCARRVIRPFGDPRSRRFALVDITRRSETCGSSGGKAKREREREREDENGGREVSAPRRSLSSLLPTLRPDHRRPFSVPICRQCFPSSVHPSRDESVHLCGHLCCVHRVRYSRESN